MISSCTVQELRQSYPNCMTAIGYIEMFLCSPPDGDDESGWDIITKTVRGNTPNPLQVKNYIRDVLKSELVDPECEIPKKVIEIVLSQIETADFQNYINGKMGAV